MRSSTRSSFFWSGLENLIPQTIGFGSTLVLARLLGPGDFGLIGMMALFTALAGTFADMGLSAALIQKLEVSADDETSVFALNMLAGLVLAAILATVAPSVARFYGQPRLELMLQVQGIGVLVASIGIVPAALMSRAMLFRRTASIAACAALAGAAIGIGTAMRGAGPWSLIFASIGAAIVKAGLTWRFSGWKPRGRVRLGRLQDSWRFSSYLLFSQVMVVAYQNVYSLVIGKVYNPTMLGYYDRANSLRLLPAGTLSAIVGRVSFPIFSRDQGDPRRLLERARELVRVTVLASAGIVCLMAVTAGTLIPTLLGSQWGPSVPLFKILSVAGLTYPVHAIYLMLLQAKGHSDLNFRLEVIKIAFGLTGILLAYRFGITALAWAVVATSLVSYFVNAWFMNSRIGYRWRLQALDILPALAAVAAASLPAWWFEVIAGGPSIPVALCQVGIFGAALMGSMYAFRERYFGPLWTLGRRLGGNG